MNRLFPLLALIAPLAASAVPLQLTHQGRLNDSAGAPLTGDQDITFALYDDAAATEAIWSEQQTVPLDAGYFAVTLGADSANALDVDALDVTTLWLGITVAGGTELQRLAVDSVPYALLAHSVVGGKVTATEVTVGSTTINTDGSISVGGSTIIGADGTVAGSAVTGLPEDSDSFADLDCSSVTGDAVAVWTGGAWACEADNAHEHAAADITSGVLDIARIPVGQESGKVMPGDATFSATDVGAVANADSCSDSSDLGNFRFTNGVIEFCDGADWREVALRADGSSATAAFNGTCADLLRSNRLAESGTYFLDLDGSGPLDTFEVTCDMETDGGGWTKFWWYTAGTTLQSGTDFLGQGFGECAPSDDTCLGRLPSTQSENSTELLAKDDAGTVYRWQFSSTNNTAHAAWLAFAEHQQTAAAAVVNAGGWNPTTVSGSFHGRAQDAWMYREENGYTGFILDDDNCDCYTTLSAGHLMCGANHSTSYGTTGQYGVDILNDNGCEGPKTSNGLQLYFR